MKVVIVFYLLAVIASTANSKIIQCAAGKGNLPNSVTVLDCNNAEDCEFIRGKSVLADFEFVAQSDVSSLNPVIYTTIGKDRSKKGLTNLPEDRLFACEWLIDGYQCPIVKGNKVIWRLNLPVSPIEMVSDSASIEIQMRSHDNSTQFCAIIVGYVSPLSLV